MRENTTIEWIQTYLYGEFTPKYDELEMTDSKPISMESKQSMLANKPQIYQKHLIVPYSKTSKKLYLEVHGCLFIFKFILH